MGRIPDCQLCHVSTAPPSWNAYGLAIQSALPRTATFTQGLPDVLRSLAAADSDEDGASNLEELSTGTLPGDATSLPRTAAEPTSDQSQANPDYQVGEHDVPFAYKRVSVLYCGHSPSYEELKPFRDEQTSADAKTSLLHERLEACLDSQYWQREGLMRLADDRIRPITNLGTDSNVVITIPIETLNGRPELKSSMGDYNYDYRLWVHALTGNRDARDLLLAQYFVEERADGTWSTTEEIIPNTRDDVTASGQLLEKPYRAGMLSTMWFITRNTMFAELPRTASSLSTTPLAVDRITLSACSQRARADKQGNPKVFTALDLSGAAPSPDAAAVKETIIALFRRLLARDPRPNEITTLQGLLAADSERMTAEDFATLSCFVVASSLEALFF